MATTNEDRARKIVREHLGVEADRITRDASFSDDLGTDSLDGVELCLATEEEFSVEMPEDDCDRVFAGTFGDLVDWIDAAVAGR